MTFENGSEKGMSEACQDDKGYRVDLTGNQYGFLTVREYDRKSKKWICECRCGSRIAVKSNNLKHGNTASCGRCGYSEAAQRDIVGGTRISGIGKKMNKNNTSGVTGVGYNRRKKKWYASIMFRGKESFLGWYHNKEDAIKARKEAEEKLHDDFLKWIETEAPEQLEKVKRKYDND